MLHGLALRQAILESLAEHKRSAGELSPMPQAELAKKLHVDLDRLDAHFTFLRMGGYIEFLHMPDPQGHRQSFVGITSEGEAYLKNARNFESRSHSTSPFKVVERASDEKLISELPELRKMVQDTEWVLDEEKPEILQRMEQLAKALDADKFDPAAISVLKLYFERHRWLAPHVSALLRKRLGF